MSLNLGAPDFGDAIELLPFPGRREQASSRMGCLTENPLLL